jgi:hypothetical protein
MMKTHNRIIYHCLTCGNVVHADEGVPQPQCCGEAMVRAAAETVTPAAVAAESAMDSFDTSLPAKRISTRPR